ncbi:MAG TPA: PadR family transcriptional regulator [Chloroflexia bacterium]|nr:PadR family transcriptional regulator [Chloroflexia bacterium]
MLETVIRSKTERGPVQRALLALLSAQPGHGYELHDRFEAALGGHWELNTGQIYSSLDRLARDGLVTEDSVSRDGGPDKRLWALTPAGEAELRAWFGAPVPRDYRLRDEFYLKLMLAVGMPDGQPARVIQVQRRELFRELHNLTARRNAADPGQELARILLLDGAIMHTEAELRWLDMVETRLDDIRGQPLPRPPPRARGRPRKRDRDES